MTNEEIVEKLERLQAMIANGELNIDDVISDEFMEEYRKLEHGNTPNP